MVLEESAHPDLTFVFRHVLIREVTYNLMLFAQRQTLHQAIADWYEARAESDPRTYGAILAHHRELAGQHEKASVALEAAAEGALGVGAFHEAARLYLRLLSLDERKLVAPTPEQRAHWRHRLGMARYSTGDLEAARGDFHEVLRTLGVASAGTPGEVPGPLSNGVLWNPSSTTSASRWRRSTARGARPPTPCCCARCSRWASR
jgi:hypothetical protein